MRGRALDECCLSRPMHVSDGLGDAWGVLHCLYILSCGAFALECWVPVLWLGARPGNG